MADDRHKQHWAQWDEEEIAAELEAAKQWRGWARLFADLPEDAELDDCQLQAKVGDRIVSLHNQISSWQSWARSVCNYKLDTWDAMRQEISRLVATPRRHLHRLQNAVDRTTLDLRTFMRDMRVLAGHPPKGFG